MANFAKSTHKTTLSKPGRISPLLVALLVLSSVLVTFSPTAAAQAPSATLSITDQPTDLTVNESEDATFVVTATGSGTLSYQWLANGAAVPGGTGSSLTLSAVTLADSGTAYSVEITDDTGSISSDDATLDVVEVAWPVTVATIGQGNLDSTTGTGPRWVRLDFDSLATALHTVNVSWDTDADIRFNVFEANGTRISSLVQGSNPGVWNGELDANEPFYIGLWSTSGIANYTATVEAPVPVSIESQPSDVIVTEGDNANFAVAAAGSGTLNYQWFADGNPLPGENADSLTIFTTSLIDDGIGYSVEVSNGFETALSDVATLTVEEAPVITVIITAQPTDLTVTEGEDATFSVTATGSGTLGYQWFADGEAIPGATTDTLLVSLATLSDGGSAYSVEITDDNSPLGSDNAILDVLEVALPVTVATIGQGTLDSTSGTGPRWVRLDFDSLATALHTITVSWDSDADVRFNVFQADGTLISTLVHGSNPGVWNGELDANEPFYIGLWSTNGIANYTATVEASVPVSIESQPSGLIVTEGDDASFMVQAAGSGTLSYQWFADGNSLPGETADLLTVSATSLFENGIGYTVEVSNGFEIITSDVATLTVNEPVVLGTFSQEADTSAWMLDGPAPTLDYLAGENTDAWGQALLRVGDILLAGGDFEGIKPTRNGPVTFRPFLAAFDAVSGQPVSTFQVPYEVDSVVRTLALSPDGNQVYIGGDFGLLILDAVTGELDLAVSFTKGSSMGRVFDIAVSDTQLYIGGDFSHVDNTFRANIARLSLDGELDSSWSPQVTHGFATGRNAPVQTLTVSPDGSTVYVGGNFKFINGTPVSTTPKDNRISMLALSALDGTVQPERFSPNVGNTRKGLTAYDIAVTDFYVIIAWGGPNYVTFHSLDGTRLREYKGRGDVQALQIVGNHVFVGHHGEYFDFLPNPVPQEALVSLDPRIILPFKIHSFRIDDPSFLPEQAWTLIGPFGVWGIAASEDSIWIAGQISRAGSNDRSVEGLARFPALGPGN